MENISSQLEVIETCSALPRPHATSRSIGVVNADLSASYQGTGTPFAGLGDVFATIDGFVPPARVRKGVPSGTTTWSPPV